MSIHRFLKYIGMSAAAIFATIAVGCSDEVVPAIDPADVGTDDVTVGDRKSVV